MSFASASKKSLHIVLAHAARIPPKKYGGTERVITHLIHGLLKKGHRVTLFSERGSFIDGSSWAELRPGDDPEAMLPEDVDLLQLWSTPKREPRVPYLVNVGGNGQLGEKYLRNTVFVSQSHAQNHHAVHSIYNGVDPNIYSASARRSRHLVFLAKASWSVKNLEGAISVARKAGRPLEVLGSRSLPLNLQRLLPRWRGVSYHGMVDDREKAEVLRDAAGLIFPVRWHEPFGIAIAEALLSGCPVFGTPYGSLPEIVTPQVGVLSDSASALARAVNEKSFDPKICREHALRLFTEDAMTDAYLELYRQILENGGLLGTPGQPDHGIPAPYCDQTAGFSSKELLPWRE